MKKTKKWKTVLALLIIYVAVVFNWYWIWGLLFIYWAIHGITSGTAYLIDPIDKKESTGLFWVVILSWVLIGIYFLSALFINYSQYGY